MWTILGLNLFSQESILRAFFPPEANGTIHYLYYDNSMPYVSFTAISMPRHFDAWERMQENAKYQVRDYITFVFLMVLP